MYDMGIPEINVTARSESEDGRAILCAAEAAHRPECCANPACGHKIKPHVHSSKTNLIHDIRSEGKLVYINLTIHRYRCPDCSYVFPDEFTFFAKNSHITDRLKQEFVDRCIKGETFTYIGNDYSVDQYLDNNIYYLAYFWITSWRNCSDVFSPLETLVNSSIKLLLKNIFSIAIVEITF